MTKRMTSYRPKKKKSKWGLPIVSVSDINTATITPQRETKIIKSQNDHAKHQNQSLIQKLLSVESIII